jgi:hypothetical protein
MPTGRQGRLSQTGVKAREIHCPESPPDPTCGGEVCKLLVSAASRAYGYNLGRSEQVPEARARFEAAIQFLRDQGLEVEVIPFGER